MIVINFIRRFIADLFVHPLAWVMRVYSKVPRYFSLWQRYGFHVTPVHFYQPIPDTRVLQGVWKKNNSLQGIKTNDQAQIELIHDFHRRYFEEYDVFRSRDSLDGKRFVLGKVSFEAVDAEIYYCMVRHFQPRKIIEVGSGHTTLLGLEAMERNAIDGIQGRFLALEPYPKPFLQSIRSNHFQMQTDIFQNTPVSVFEDLKQNDILFIDSSHVCKIGSDVQYLFSDVLPRLASGVIVHLHDIFLPSEYPRSWVMDENRFWNEQYILQAFLCFNTRFRILCAASFLHTRYPNELTKVFPSYDPKSILPGSIWLQVTELNQ